MFYQVRLCGWFVMKMCKYNYEGMTEYEYVDEDVCV